MQTSSPPYIHDMTQVRREGNMCMVGHIVVSGIETLSILQKGEGSRGNEARGGER